jgi:hypothetical protein
LEKEFPMAHCAKRPDLKFGLVAPLISLIFLVACTDTKHYPISGEECGPDDPVKSLDPSDCMQLG